MILILLTRQRLQPVSPDTIAESALEEEGLGGGEEGSDACGIDDDDGPKGGVIAQILGNDTAEKDGRAGCCVPRRWSCSGRQATCDHYPGR